MSSNKILSVLNQQIQNNNNLIKSYEKNLASVELKDGNVFLIYDDFSKINLGKFLDNDNSVYKEAKLVKKNYGHDLALTTTSDEVLVINNIEESKSGNKESRKSSRSLLPFVFIFIIIICVIKVLCGRHWP